MKFVCSVRNNLVIMKSTPLELKVANRYILNKKLGSGAFGDIYHGTSPRA